MAEKKNISLMDFPEEKRVEKNVGIGITFYGETSYENQMAVLSHYLHNHKKKLTKKEQSVIIDAVRDFLSRKEMRQKIDITGWSDEQVMQVAEDPAQYNLFNQFLMCHSLRQRSRSLRS